MRAAIVWSALTDNAILGARSAMGTGPWIPDPLHRAMASARAGATLRGSAQGGAVYIGFYQRAIPMGSFDVSIDGRVAGRYSCQAPPAPSSSTTAAATIWPAAARIGEGAHVVTVSAHGDGPVILDWMAGSGGHGPRVVVGTLQELPVRSYRLFAPLDHGSDTATALYNAMYADLVCQLAVEESTKKTVV